MADSVTISLRRYLSSPKVVSRLRRRRGTGSPPLPGGTAARILVVRLDEIGDLVLFSPFLCALREAFPASWITLVVQPLLANLVELCPHVDEVLTFDWRSSGRLWKARRIARAWGFSKQYLRPRAFDLALVPRYGDDHYFAAYLAFFSAAPRRVGYSERVDAVRREVNWGFDSLLTTALPPSGHVHEVERNLEVLRHLGARTADPSLELWLGAEDTLVADRLLAERDPKRPLVAIAPGAGAPKRCWPADRFAAVGRRLVDELGADVVSVGGPDERELTKPLHSTLGESLIDAVGHATLRQTAALLSRCDLFIGNDAGPMHLAAAARVPVVEISCHPEGAGDDHANSPMRFGPWGVPNEIVRPPQPRDPCRAGCEADRAHCILDVSGTRVQAAAERLFAAIGRRSGGEEQ